ncbi:MAG: 2-hydroxyacid dehydrogenase [Candidatus Caenarcaniphilales bacterium]|nr:2-hydroxyacid dehydrogenase [Candidatus Caenarcaniphilales bacterium]
MDQRGMNNQAKAKILFFDAKPYEIENFKRFNRELNYDFELDFLELKLNHQTASLAQGYEYICIFVHDQANDDVLKILKDQGVKLIALRCAGYNNVSLNKAKELGINVVRVPEYSPYAVAEHALALLMTLNRKIHRAYARVRENNFALNGLMGFDVHGKTVGVIGTGKIGLIMTKLMAGMGCRVIAYDLYPNQIKAKEIGFDYCELADLLANSDIISLHTPLTPETHYLVNAQTISDMKDGVVIINTSRGALIDTAALIEGLKSGKIQAAGLDVYEEEDAYFFEDFSDQLVLDDQLARLMSFNNVIITAHQAFLTREAIEKIVQVTLSNITDFINGKDLANKC